MMHFATEQYANRHDNEMICLSLGISYELPYSVQRALVRCRANRDEASARKVGTLDHCSCQSVKSAQMVYLLSKLSPDLARASSQRLTEGTDSDTQNHIPTYLQRRTHGGPTPWNVKTLDFEDSFR